MAQLLQMFDATQVEPKQSGGQSLPVGKHPVVIESSEIKATQANDGGYLQLDLRVIDGPAAGASGAMRLNLYSSSTVAAQIAAGQMSALCHATGVFKVNESSQLHNIPFMVEVVPQTKGEGAEKGYTQVSKILDRNGNEPGKPATNNAQPQQQPNAGFNQQPQQNTGFQQPQQNNGGFSQPQENQQPQNNGGGGWGAPNTNQQQPPQQPQQPQQNAGGWNNANAQPQNNGGPSTGGTAAWGQQR